VKHRTIKTGVQRALHCRCGREKILALGLCATCYTLKRQDDEYFGGLREPSSGAGPSLLPSLRSVRTAQALYCCPSPRAWKIVIALDDFSLSRLSRQSEPHKGRPLGDAAASFRAMARATSPWTRANNDRFHNTPAGSSSCRIDNASLSFARCDLLHLLVHTRRWSARQTNDKIITSF
jgi:hypothetical protein